MQCLDRARSIVRGIYRISLPDPDRIDIGAVPDTATLLGAIAATFPDSAVLELIRLREGLRAALLRKCQFALRQKGDAMLVPLEGGVALELAGLTRDLAADAVCSHLFVHQDRHTLLEAFGRDRGEDVVWLTPRVDNALRRRFIDALVPNSRTVEIRLSGATGPEPRWRIPTLLAR